MEDKITKLIEEFYEGSTSIQEENKLREWLQQNKDSRYTALQQYFALIDAERQRTMPTSVEEKIVENFLEKKKNRRPSIIKIGIAASVACFITVGILWKFDLLKKSPQYSEAEIQQSYTQARSALMTISTYLNNGMQQLSIPSVMEKPFQDLHKLSEIKFLEEHDDK